MRQIASMGFSSILFNFNILHIHSILFERKLPNSEPPRPILQKSLLDGIRDKVKCTALDRVSLLDDVIKKVFISKQKRKKKEMKAQASYRATCSTSLKRFRPGLRKNGAIKVDEKKKMERRRRRRLTDVDVPILSRLSEMEQMDAVSPKKSQSTSTASRR